VRYELDIFIHYLEELLGSTINCWGYEDTSAGTINYMTQTRPYKLMVAQRVNKFLSYFKEPESLLLCLKSFDLVTLYLVERHYKFATQMCVTQFQQFSINSFIGLTKGDWVLFVTIQEIKSIIFWDTAPCSRLGVSRRFGGTCRLLLQGRNNTFGKKTSKKAGAKLSTCLLASLLLGLFFDSEDGGDMFLRNVGWHSTDYTALYPKRWHSS
jgi:hypothetical protein